VIPPVSHPDGASVEAVASYVATCARGWEPGARLLGNARAEDIARMAEWAVAIAPLIERLRQACIHRGKTGDAGVEDRAVRELLLAADAAARGAK
jgi:hypothetical protein